MNPALRGRGLLRVLLYTLLTLLLIGYSIYQARFLIKGPGITVQEPETVVQSERVITVSGGAHNVVLLTLNGRAINTTEDGIFEEMLVLPHGYTIMTLTATDRYGRETTTHLPLVYQPNS